MPAETVWIAAGTHAQARDAADGDVFRLRRADAPEGRQGTDTKRELRDLSGGPGLERGDPVRLMDVREVDRGVRGEPGAWKGEWLGTRRDEEEEQEEVDAEPQHRL